MFRLKISIFVVIVLLFSGCKDQGLNSIEGNDNPKSLEFSSPANKGNIVSEPLGSQLISSDGSPLVNRVMSLSDPMRDPNWDWMRVMQL